MNKLDELVIALVKLHGDGTVGAAVSSGILVGIELALNHPELAQEIGRLTSTDATYPGKKQADEIAELLKEIL